MHLTHKLLLMGFQVYLVVEYYLKLVDVIRAKCAYKIQKNARFTELGNL